MSDYRDGYRHGRQDSLEELAEILENTEESEDLRDEIESLLRLKGII